jgi:GT2 family glycosyltransferase
MSPIRFSIIVPAHRDGPALRTCLDACLEQEYANFEVIVASDRAFPGMPGAVTVVETGSRSDTSPAVKRDAAFSMASGDVLAYVDDDAYPRPNWLARAARHFEDPDLQALGGPGLTPPNSPWRERVGGAVYESPAGSGQLRYRFLPLAPRSVTDYPAYNLFVRRVALQAVNGWGTAFYGGEDTVLCLKLAEAGWPVRYAPDVVVYHRRRPIVGPHLRQVANVGRHRGYFVRAFPATSRRAVYCLPAFLPGALALGAIGVWRRPAVGLSVAAAGYTAVAAESLRRHPLSVALAAPVVTVGHHLAYGTAFLRGLFGARMTR